MGSEGFVAAHSQERMASEQELLEAIPAVPDLQSAWQILVQCAGPRCNHLLRTVPPDLVASYADAHDEAMWACATKLLGEPPAILCFTSIQVE